LKRACWLVLGALPCWALSITACGGRARSIAEPASAGASAAEFVGGSGGAAAGASDRSVGGTSGGATSAAAGVATQLDAGAAGQLEDCSEIGAGDAPTGDLASLSSVAPRTLSLAVQNQAWAAEAVVGMAVDTSGRVYLANAAGIDQVDGITLTPYLTLDEARAQADLHGGNGFRALDIDDAGTLYSILSSTVISSARPHQAGIWRAQPSLSVQLGVVGVNDVALVSMQSLWRVTLGCEQRLFTNGELLGLDCGGAQLTVARSGTFLYLADCGVNQLYRGRANGSELGALYSGNAPAGLPFSQSQFSCAARDPAGGFYVVSDDGAAWQLSHLTETAQGDLGFAPILIEPSLAEAKSMQQAGGDARAFEQCKVAASADGTVFLQTSSLLWRLTPAQ
jgi:hypothetical protein